MQIAEKIDFSLFCEQVAIDLWGPPNQRLSNDKEVALGCARLPLARPPQGDMARP
jgi:hypothetical protein